MIYVNFIINVMIILKKKIGGVTVLPPLIFKVLVCLAPRMSVSGTFHEDAFSV
jgi:hypothetical protein